MPSVDDIPTLNWVCWSHVQACSAHHAQSEVPRGSQELAERVFALRGGCGHNVNGVVPARGEQWELSVDDIHTLNWHAQLQVCTCMSRCRGVLNGPNVSLRLNCTHRSINDTIHEICNRNHDTMSYVCPVKSDWAQWTRTRVRRGMLVIESLRFECPASSLKHIILASHGTAAGEQMHIYAYAYSNPRQGVV